MTLRIYIFNGVVVFVLTMIIHLLLNAILRKAKQPEKSGWGILTVSFFNVVTGTLCLWLGDLFAGM